MPSEQFHKILDAWRRRGRLPDDAPLEEMRSDFEGMAFPAPDDVTLEAVDAGGVPAEWLTAPGADAERAVLYLHGGGYAIGSLRSHRKLASDVSRAARARVLLLDYRLAPEHPHPAALDDSTAAYRWLLGQGLEPRRLAVAGDSAGGGLTIATLVSLRDAGSPLPAAGVCISPWVDLSCTAASFTENADLDPMVSRTLLQRMGSWYLCDLDPRTPLAAPLHADLSGLPPLLIHVGGTEVLRDDAVALADRARAAGVEVTLGVWPEMMHVWHVFCGRVPEASQAMEEVGNFLRRHMRATTSTASTQHPRR